MGMNQKILAGLVHLMAIMFVTMIVINALGGAGYKDLFNQSTGQVSDNYKSYITPAGFTFSIWSVIYIFLGAGAIYSLASVYRKSDGSSNRVYVHPIILNWLFYVALSTNFCLNTVWMILWDRKLMVVASIVLLLIACTGWLSFAVAVVRGKRAMEKKRDGLSKTVVFKEVRLQRILIHNGIALYTTWTTIASLLNINIAFQYFGNTDAETTSLVCSSILLIIMLGWFFIENTYWLDPYVRYTVTQYPVIIFGTFGILSKQADPNRTDGPVPESVRILTWIILGVASIQLAVRLVIVIYRYRTRPLFESEPVPTAVQNE
ncbi:hypothetical protein DAPPUDRAFT_309800 [Daphnia pulex]|uniref:Uncharacterized protein n=1 Tax=Daphnia pulex TaxID=6669 RepID=E9FQU8_DAPPU|nr:hypothetical protein DAPPUDRAFT_309800 [Daphnia pulex]|eukprot:EFX90051.1 hypothetical protein DAPPUDRAFT_309800 [Daphnia pulex]